MNWWQYLLLMGLPIIGGALAYVVPNSQKHLRLLLTFSGAYLFGITILHLLPAAYAEPSFQVGLFILLGFVMQLLLDLLSHGVEHGHLHLHEKESPPPYMALSIMVGLSIHAFLEGIPLTGVELAGHGHQHMPAGDHTEILPLLWGIALHKIPAAFALMAILTHGKMSRLMCWICLLIFSLMSPLAAFITSWISEHATAQILTYIPYVFGLVIGSFMHISTTILFEVGTPVHNRFNVGRWLSIVLGLGLAVLTILL